MHRSEILENVRERGGNIGDRCGSRRERKAIRLTVSIVWVLRNDGGKMSMNYWERLTCPTMTTRTSPGAQRDSALNMMSLGGVITPAGFASIALLRMAQYLRLASDFKTFHHARGSKSNRG